MGTSSTRVVTCSMASSDPGGAAARRPALLWVVIAVGTLVGLTVIAVPVLAPESVDASRAVGYGLAGLALLSGPASLWLRWLAPRRPTAAVIDGRTAAGPAVVVRLRPHLVLGSLVVGATWCAFLLWAGLAVGIGDGGWVLALLALLPAALVPDAVRGLARGSRLVIDADEVVLHGFTSAARLAWDDVVAVEVAAAGLPALRVQARAGAPSWRLEPRRWLVDHDRLARTDRAGAIDVPLAVLDAPDRVGLLLQELRLRARPERADRLDTDAASFLRGERGSVCG